MKKQGSKKFKDISTPHMVALTVLVLGGVSLAVVVTVMFGQVVMAHAPEHLTTFLTGYGAIAFIGRLATSLSAALKELTK